MSRLSSVADDDAYDGSGWANVIAIDPGGTTGWSVLSCHPDALSDGSLSVLDNIEHWTHGEIGGDEDKQAEFVMGMIDAWDDAAVVCEDFILRVKRKDRDLLSPVRIAAKVEFGMKFWPGMSRRELFYQPSSLALRTCTDERLQSWGFYQRDGGEEHARDADRHGLLFLRRAKEQEGLRQQAWPHLYVMEDA